MFGSTLEPSQILLITHTNGHCPSLIRSLDWRVVSGDTRPGQAQLTVILVKKRNTINLEVLTLRYLTLPPPVSGLLMNFSHYNVESCVWADCPSLVTIEIMSSPGQWCLQTPGAVSSLHISLSTPLSSVTLQPYLPPLLSVIAGCAAQYKY